MVETPPVQVAVRIFYVSKLTIESFYGPAVVFHLSIMVGRSEFEVGSGGPLERSSELLRLGRVVLSGSFGLVMPCMSCAWYVVGERQKATTLNFVQVELYYDT